MDSNNSRFSGEPRTHRIRTNPIGHAQPLAAFQRQLTQFLQGVHVEPLHDQPLALESTITSFDSMVISIARTTPTRCTHPDEEPIDDGVLLMGMPVGKCRLQVRSKTWDMVDKDMVFARPGQMQSVVAYTPAHLCSVLLSRSLLSSMGIDVDAILLRPLRDNPTAALFTQYAHLLCDHSALASPELRRAATLHLHDLAALLAGASGDMSHRACGRGVRGARLLTIKNDIAARFTDPAISVIDVARRQNITPRYLQMLLEQDGLTFTALVLERRLALARRMLQDPRMAKYAISAIAFDVGFGDLSHFNKSFRIRYGLTPSEARRCAPGERH
ncbi:helix-turn-helix transcriptional regulator [Ottowia thiooxydans]|uniref:AraC-like DNA-binding protein n=1 Tax=Ottowia thiooxydans TaxID=219182 RepID=A0ABV2QG82_9BURK